MRDFSFYQLIMCTFAAAFGIATAKAGYTTVETRYSAFVLHCLCTLYLF